MPLHTTRTTVRSDCSAFREFGKYMAILSVLCLCFLMMSAFFAFTETSLFSIPRERINAFQNHGARSRRLIYALLLDGQRTLLLILLGNLFVNITLAGLINSLMAKLFGEGSILLTFLIATVAIVVIGDILPKNIALRWNEQIAAASAPIVHGLKTLTSPLLNVVLCVNRFFLAHFKFYLRQPSPFITIDELKSALRSSFERGVISKFEQGIVTNLLERGAQPVKRFAAHRSQIPFLPHYATASEALEELARRKQTCALVTRGPRSHQVIGVVRLPDLLAADPADRCRRLAKPPQWVPETLDAADLISFMFAERLSVVCVLDEFGGLSGIFSLADGLSKVMNFRRERSGGGGSKIFPGLQEIDGIAEWLPEPLSPAVQSARTLNGALTRHLGRIPKTGEQFDIDGVKFYIMESSYSRIESVLIKKSVF